MDTRPLADVKVLELASWVAAPGAAALLADLGADVVKVEPVRGDPARTLQRQPKRAPGQPPLDAPFHVDNRGKQSVAIAIDRPAGAALVRQLVAQRDVFLTNLLPTRQHKYGLDPSTLLEVQPRLVHATLTGYGLTGPDATRPGYDVTAFFGRGAILDAMTEPGSPPPAPRPGQGDHTTSLAIVAGVLAALRLVERTGQGQVVDTSLFAVATWTMGSELAPVLVDGREPSRRDRRHLISPLANRFPCGDGRWIVLNMPEPHWWPRFCEAIGRTDLLQDPRFETVKGRFDHMPELIDALDATFATRGLAEWGEIFDAAGLIWGPASTVTELVDDPQAAAVDLFPELELDGERFRTVGGPLSFGGVRPAPRGPAPSVGQHTAAVLSSLGLTDAEIDALVADGIVSVGPSPADASADSKPARH